MIIFLGGSTLGGVLTERESRVYLIFKRGTIIRRREKRLFKISIDEAFNFFSSFWILHFEIKLTRKFVFKIRLNNHVEGSIKHVEAFFF